MIFPITAYGHPSLRRQTKEIDKDFPGLHDLIDSMYESMYAATGVGLAAPQIDKSIRLFVIDGSVYDEDMPETIDFKKVFINPKIIEESGEKWSFTEGCLSLPGIREDISRYPEIRIQYYDKNFTFFDEKYNGLLARIIQHEYDHLEGVLFVDRLSVIRRNLLRRKLTDISKGNVDIDYRMKFPLKRQINNK